RSSPFFFSRRRRHTRSTRDWSSDVCSSDLSFFGGDGRKPLDLLRVDDGQIQPGLRRVVQENRIHHLASARGQPKGNVRNAQNRAHFGQSLLDQPDAFHRLDRSADIVFIPGGAREDQGIENDVLRSEPVFLRQQLVGTLGNRELPLARNRLSLQLVLLGAADHYRPSPLLSTRPHAFASFLPLLPSPASSHVYPI